MMNTRRNQILGHAERDRIPTCDTLPSEKGTEFKVLGT